MNKVGDNNGKVILKNFLTAPAPSISAASYKPGEMPVKAALYKIKLKPTLHHVIIIIIAVIKYFGSVSQAMASTPNQPKNWLMIP